MVERSGGETFATPRTIRLGKISQTIVQPAWTSLPEFEFVRDHTVAAPPLRTWDVVFETLARRVEKQFERLAAVHNLTLLRGVDTPTALDRPRCKVGIGLGGR